MSVPTVLFIVALVLTAIDLIRPHGLVGVAVLLICLGLLWGFIA